MINPADRAAQSARITTGRRHPAAWVALAPTSSDPNQSHVPPSPGSVQRPAGIKYALAEQCPERDHFTQYGALAILHASTVKLAPVLPLLEACSESLQRCIFNSQHIRDTDMQGADWEDALNIQYSQLEVRRCPNISLRDPPANSPTSRAHATWFEPFMFGSGCASITRRYRTSSQKLTCARELFSKHTLLDMQQHTSIITSASRLPLLPRLVIPSKLRTSPRFSLLRRISTDSHAYR